MNRYLQKLVSRTLKNSGYRLIPDNIPRTHHFALDHFEEAASEREWQQLMMYANVFERSKDIPGDIAEFGVASGTSFKAFVRMNGIHNKRRPHQLAKKSVYGFDTFDGLPALDPKIDLATYNGIEPGDMKTGGYHSRGTLPQLKHFCSTHANCSLIEGLFAETLPQFIARNPHISFSLIHIDCDIYKSTYEALLPTINRVNVGGIILFDEIFHEGFPGETQAFFEVYDLFKNSMTLEFERVESMSWKWFCVRTR